MALERTAPFEQEGPVIFAGDFNSRPTSEAWRILTDDTDAQGFALVDSHDIADEWSIVTNQDPEPDYDLQDRIDHIFVAGEGVTWSVSSWLADLTVYGSMDRYPSDHRPIVAELTYE